MAPAQNPTTYDVLIAGAGPVGLALAGELALAGCSVLLLEKAADPHSPLKKMPFGIRGLNAPTIEGLNYRGLLPEFELHKQVKNPYAATGPGPQRQAGGHFAGIQFFADAVDLAQWPNRLPGSPPTHLVSELAEVEAVLARRADALGVVRRYGLGITGFVQTETGVTVQAGDHTFTGSWLVGCDGGRSTVRKAAGFEFAGTEPEFTGYTAQVDIADPEKLRPGRVVTATGMYLQSQPGYLILQDFDGGAFHASGQPVTQAHLQQTLRRISGTDVTINAVHLATAWTDRARQATTYRRGRVLLAGDAAHIHSPLGGQGLNLGLGDAMNLGWKLAATVRGQAPAGLLDSYTTERHPLGARVLDWSRAQVALMNPSPQARALHAIVRDLVDTRDGATYIASRVWGTLIHYDDLGSPHPLVGYSVPSFELANGTMVSEMLRDGHGLLLDFEGSATLEAVAASYGGQLKYVAHPAKDQLGLSAVLVRPDGIVAWATGLNPDPDSLQQSANRWFTASADSQR